MTHVLALLLLTASPSMSVEDLEPAHRANRDYLGLVMEGVVLGGTRVTFPPPRLRSGQTDMEQHRALMDLAGGERALDDLLRDSITAPFVLKVRDATTKAGDPIRMADLVFAVHADLSAIDPAEAARQSAGKVAEVANMRIETTLLPPEALKALKLPPPEPGRDWYAHLSARLLDRIQVESTDHVVVTRAEDSFVVTSRTDSRFGRDSTAPNLWNALARDGKPSGESQPYEGGASYTKISRLKGSPGVLVVESRFAFVEPKAWFDGAPILRSKFSPIAQDQIRRLRREVKARTR